jgi:hypothetical protein
MITAAVRPTHQHNFTADVGSGNGSAVMTSLPVAKKLYHH